MAPGNPRRQTRDFGSASWKCWLPRFLEEVYRLGGLVHRAKTHRIDGAANAVYLPGDSPSSAGAVFE